jgi:DNA polymerase-3 subunit delta
MKEIISSIQNLSDTNVTVFYYTGLDITEGKKSLPAKAKKIADLTMNIGSVYICNPKTPAALAIDIEKYVASLDAEITSDDALYLAEVTGCDTMTARNECEKLASYTDKIDRNTIDSLTPKLLEANIFDLSRAVVQNNKILAFDILKKLLYMRVEPIAILAALSGSMLDFYRAKTALLAARSTQSVKDDFLYQRNLSFRVDNAFRDTRRISLPFLQNAVRILSSTDVKMKSSAMDNVILLQTALVQIMK